MRHLLAATLFLTTVGLAEVARAEETKQDPTGTWKWTVERNGMKRDLSIKLKLDGDKLTGSVPGPNNQETPIENGTYKKGEVSFTVTRERNGQKFTQKYHGKIDGDTLKGKIEFERNGETQSRDWEATRAK
jgi:hypothetical protein